MLIGNIIFLARIDVHIIQLFAVDKPPAVCHNRAFTPLLRMLDSLRVGDKGSVGPVFVRTLQKRYKSVTIEADSGGFLQSAKFYQTRQQVDMGC